MAVPTGGIPVSREVCTRAEFCFFRQDVDTDGQARSAAGIYGGHMDSNPKTCIGAGCNRLSGKGWRVEYLNF